MAASEQVFAEIFARWKVDPRVSANVERPITLVIDSEPGCAFTLVPGSRDVLEVPYQVAHSGSLNPTEAAACTISATADVWRRILSGAQSPQHAFLSGDLRVRGEVQAALPMVLLLVRDPAHQATHGGSA
jgi:putative sterol carrier protein